jgi:outer membrane protein assembly factor BamB
MTQKNVESNRSVHQKPLRLWLGVALVVIQWILWLILPKFEPSGQTLPFSVFGGLAGGLAIIIWWTFLSRALWLDRIVGVSFMILSLLLFPSFAHKSVETGLSGMMFYIYAVPVLSLSFVIWAILSQRMSQKLKRITMALTILISCGAFTLVRSDGITGNANAELVWRWATTNEQLLLEEQVVPKAENITIRNDAEILWAGFRGTNRDGIVRGVQIETDWKKNPPVEMWRKPVGPGCSSFSVKGNLLYTQEQRGEDETVSCYNLNTGELIWLHKDKARFWDSHAGAGPRSTPTLHDSLVCTLGATGILNLLNADDGSVVWSRNAAEDIKLKLPGWGIASSPLIIDDMIIVAVSGTVVGYDLKTGEQRWTGPEGGENYSSPHLFICDSTRQVVMMDQNAVRSFSPNDGKILWEKTWGGGAIIQPAITPDGDILVSEGYKKGIHHIGISKQAENWKIEENGCQPKYILISMTLPYTKAIFMVLKDLA